MNILDIVVIVVFLGVFTAAFFAGVARSLAGLGSLVAATIVAAIFYGTIGTVLSRWLIPIDLIAILHNAGETSGIQRFGEHSWYAEGSVYLTARQRPIAGSWKGAGHMEDELVSTAMALLFLKRGPRRRGGDIVGGAAGR